MSSEATAKKNVQKLQRVIVDGLEDVKGHDIQVFNTEGLSPLFERVIVASGTSNRQTKALAASVRDAVREAGFDKPRMEGEDNGEWIIVDCGAAVVHVMQPSIRQYYRLEDIWGDKPVRMKHGEAKPRTAAAPEPAPARKAPAKKTAVAPRVPGRKTPAPRATPVAAKATVKAAAAAKASSAAKAPARAAPRPTAGSRARPVSPQPGAKLAVVKVGAPAKKAAAKKSAAKPASKTAARKAAPAKRSPRA
jgi:ribosome-associated protein